ncbi:urease accessory protein UreD [Tsukamurella soli]|uniref:Urease accessory protein UreD n=1 Tax=Tsukamurella soli TaxID=644556 RepID=A0ABP8KGS6_9ACTN
MITRLRIEAYPDRLPLLVADGALAARITGPSRIHLVSTAATPVGADETVIEVVVHPGTRLELTSVAATVVYPGRDGRPSRTTWRLSVADGGGLDLAPQPTVVAAAARHIGRTEVSLAAGAVVRISERVQIGRLGETGGAWSGTLWADVAGLPHLRHTVELGAGAVVAETALLSVFEFPCTGSPVVSVPPAHGVAVLPLEGGGTLTTALAGRVADLDGYLALARPSL